MLVEYKNKTKIPTMTKIKQGRISLESRAKVFQEGGKILNGIRVGREGTEITRMCIRGWGHFHS